MCLLCAVCVEYFFFNDTATTEIYTLSLHDALPILDGKTRLGLGVLGAALVLGLLGDWLLRATPWGVNLFLWVAALVGAAALVVWPGCLRDRKSTRLNSSHANISYAVFCLKKKKYKSCRL